LTSFPYPWGHSHLLLQSFLNWAGVNVGLRCPAEQSQSPVNWAGVNVGLTTSKMILYTSP
jgi:hypothetical protein